MAIDRRRLQLQRKLEAIIGSGGKVYFQPPESVKLEYPCIIYERARGDAEYADNGTYLFTKGYSVTCITRDPDSSIVDDMMNSFSMISYNRHFSSDNLNHDVFIIYW